MSGDDQGLKEDVKGKALAVVERGKDAKSWWEESSWGRGLKRFSIQNGNVLAAGIAYFSLASIAAGLVIATTLATVVFANNQELRENLVDYLAEAVPGMIDTEDSTGLIQPDDLGAGSASTFAGVVGIASFLILINTASRFVAGLRISLRTMLGGESATAVTGKLRDLGALLGLVLVALVGLAIQVAASSAAEWFADLVGIGMPSWGVRAIATGAGLVADMLYVALAMMLLGGARWSRRLGVVILVAAVVIGILRALVSLIVSGATDNPVLAPFAAVITLMIFVDYVNRVILMCAAWMGAHGRDPHEGRLVPTDDEEGEEA